MGMTASVLATTEGLKNLSYGVSALSSAVSGGVKAGQADSEAKALRLEASQNSINILRATSQRRAAARAATAASGVKIDQFSMISEDAIDQAGESDAAMTLLNGRNAARARRSQGQLSFAKGLGGAATSLMRMDISGWKGAVGEVSSTLDPRYTDTGKNLA